MLTRPGRRQWKKEDQNRKAPIWRLQTSDSHFQGILVQEQGQREEPTAPHENETGAA